jgi:ABC-type branched-subunit amino acid transport system ATPase component
VTATLTARGIRVSFGAVHACRDVDLDAAPGVITGLIGPNGSGKSTLLNALTGVVTATGTVHVGDRSVALGQPGPSRRAGILRTHQTPHNYADLSCLDNACLAMLDPASRTVVSALFRRRQVARHERRRWELAAASLERVGLSHLAEVPAAALTYGQARLLELARSLAGDPAVLLMDEPSAGLNAAETDGLAELLESVRADGITMVLVDHKVDFLDVLCDRIVVLELGAVIAEGTPETVWQHEQVINAYLGVSRGARG